MVPLLCRVAAWIGAFLLLGGTAAAIPPYPPAPVPSPIVAADGRVTFRLAAPQAGAVRLLPQFADAVDMQRGEDGVWSATLGPLEPEIYEYSFLVDGLNLPDPGNSRVKPMRGLRVSAFEIENPAGGPWQYDPAVPHGKVTAQWYWSQTLGRRRPVQVYTPPDYEKDPLREFPVVYLLHGSGDNEVTWTAHGQVHWMLDNLIATGSARSMVVVMLDGNAVPPVPGLRGDGHLVTFEKDLLGEAMPFIAVNYRVQRGGETTAVVGASMGGAQALYLGFRHPDRFGWVAAMSSAVPFEPEIDLHAGMVARRLLWISCGSQDSVFARNQAFVARLAGIGVPHEFHPSAGRHSWVYWRQSLRLVLPRLFLPDSSKESLKTAN